MKRIFIVAISIVATTAVIAAAVWFAWLPNYRPSLQAGQAYGIDVSSHQGQIDWKKVEDDNVRFTYIKATEGSDFVDKRFNENWNGATAMKRGAYHFYTLCSVGKDQVNNFIKTVPHDDAALPPAIDLELAGNCHSRPSADELHAQLQTFVDQVEAAINKQVVLYIGDDFENRYHVTSWLDRKQWKHRFLRHPVSNDWLIWQVDGFAHVNGIQSRVDLDIGQNV